MKNDKYIQQKWRYYFFYVEEQNFCFDCFTHKIFSLSDGLYKLLYENNYERIRKEYPVFYRKVILKKELSESARVTKKERKCKVTINISNKCNLNCVYCYRNKSEKSELSESELDEIFKYIKQDYMSDADCYNFSFCNTSESSLDLEKLRFIDTLIAKYEGYYFSKETIDENQLLKLYKQLPEIIKEKHPLENVYTTLNNILETEQLWTIFDYNNNDYLVSVITGKDDLSLSRKVMANRQIINKSYAELKLERPIKYISFWFMTNGTNITDEFIVFLKSIFMKEVTVSIDGNEEIHNYSRKYFNGTGSFEDTLSGIKKLQSNGIEVIASITVTPAYPDFLNIIDYLFSLGIKKITFNLVRGTKENTFFNNDSLTRLIDNWKVLYKFVYDEIVTGEYHYISILKGCFAFSILNNLFYRVYRTTRCNWEEELVIDSKGNMFHCNSTIGCEEDYLGNYKDKKKFKDLKCKKRNVNTDTRCINCFAKYLCGGTCYANDVLKNINGRKQECVYRNALIKASLELYARLYKNGLLSKFIDAIS